MSNVTTTSRPRATVEAATVANVYNISVLLANTEVSQALATGTKKITIKVRGNSTLKLSFSSGGPYITIPQGATWSNDGLNFNGTLYFQTTKPSQIVEIEEWT